MVVLPSRRGGALQEVVLGPWYVGETPDALTLKTWNRSRSSMSISGLSPTFEWWVDGVSAPVSGAISTPTSSTMRLTLPAAQYTGTWRGRVLAQTPIYTIRVASLYANILPAI
jgi:hypothetical protein